MKAMIVLLPTMLLAACSKGAEQAAPTQAAPAATEAAAAASPSPVATPAAKAVKVQEEGKLFSFSYSYPAAAAAIPALKTRLDGEQSKARSELVNTAKEGRDEASASGYEFNPYETAIEWTVVADLPGWLSLLGSSYSFTGGAHGNSGTNALLWDKAAGQARDPLSLFASKQAFDAALGKAYCAALNKERAKRREQPVNPNSGDEFDRCLMPSEVTVLLGSADKAHFTRIGLIADPYMAGSYAEGSYEVTLPVTPALIAAVKPEFRSSFAVGR